MGRKGNEKKIGNPITNMVSVAEKLHGSQAYSKKNNRLFQFQCTLSVLNVKYYLSIDCNSCRGFTDNYYTQVFLKCSVFLYRSHLFLSKTLHLKSIFNLVMEFTACPGKSLTQ